MTTGSEMAGPVVVTRDLVINGQGTSVCARQGPVVIVKAGHLALKNLVVEMTGTTGEGGVRGGCVIEVLAQGRLSTENVEVRGSVIGVAQEEGAWELPRSVAMGRIDCNSDMSIELHLVVGAACKVVSKIEALHVSPEDLNAGPQVVHLAIEGDSIRRDTLLHGSIQLVTGAVRRKVGVTGFMVDGATEAGHHQPAGVLWRASSWDKPVPNKNLSGEVEWPQTLGRQPLPTAPASASAAAAAGPVLKEGAIPAFSGGSGGVQEENEEEIEKRKEAARDGDLTAQEWLLERSLAW